MNDEMNESMGDEAKRRKKVFLRFVTTHSRCSINICVTDEAASNKDMHNYTHTHTHTKRKRKTKGIIVLL